jgi:hypothetical protein
MIRTGAGILFGLCSAALAGAAPAEPKIPAVVKFNRDVRPIMANTCFKCHGPDMKANRANLRMDLPENAMAVRHDKSGREFTPIVPGKPEQSEVWRRVSSADAGTVMPPPDSLHLLSAHDKEVLRRWIEQGAVYEKHWAYVAPRKVEPPQVASHATSPIDRFIQKELEENGVTPSPEADRRTLIRRLSLDLVGLPPSPEETDAFVSDKQPQAYERLVDRLLASPHYGERMAVGWLDLARFADTVGYHGDQLYNNFPYRDWVIGAFNANMPYDEFTREQLAGDLLPNPTQAQRTATGFNRLNMVTREGGAQPNEYLAKYAGDRVRTVSTTWLGSTMACCECHDHKYDPFKSRDFYAMEAYFSDIKQWGVYEDYSYTPEPELKYTTNDSPFPPEIEVDSPYLKARGERMRKAYLEVMESVSKRILADPARAEASRRWAAELAPILRDNPTGWIPMKPLSAKPKRDGTLSSLPDASVRIEPPKPSPEYRGGDGAVLTLDVPAATVARVRLEVLPDDKYSGRVTSNKDDVFTVSLELNVLHAGSDKPEHIDICDGYPEQRTKSYFNGQIETSITGDWTSPRELVNSAQALDYVLGIPTRFAPGDKFVATVSTENAGRVRLSFSPIGLRGTDPASPADVDRAILAADRTPDEASLVAREYFSGTRADRPFEFGQVLDYTRQVAACRGGKAFTTVVVSVAPRVTRILPRGNWQDETGAVVQPSTPGFLPGAPAAGAPRQSRLDLANWIVSRENPLTARTFVNRLWKQFFGNGLSGIVDDLGTQGEYPTHPELLDWLAVEFMDRGWDMKAMVREIVLSQTYRQSSRLRPELEEEDPGNRLLARQSPRRLEAEFVRDNALSAAGLIDLSIGGPSAHPYQPAGYYVALQFPDRDYIPDGDERQYRRGVYVHWQRTFLHPMLANFDAPSREECTASRVVSSTPQQALTLLNDPTFVEASRGLAEEAMHGRDPADFPSVVREEFLRLLSREPNAREEGSLQKFFETQLAYYRSKPAEASKLLAIGYHRLPLDTDAPELAAWTSVARVLMNLNETIVRY